MCDLGTAIHEKYGDFTSWKMKLRHSPRKDNKDLILESEIDLNIGGIYAKAKDDRGKRIWIIRKTVEGPKCKITQK